MALSPSDLAIAAVRWLEYVGLLATLGMFVVRRLAALPPRLDWVRPPMHLALAAALAGGLGVVVGEALRTSAAPGAAGVLRVAAEGLALVLCLRGVRLVAAPAVLAAAALAFAGHAARVSPAAAGAIFADAVHVLSAGMWAGGIMAMATLRPPGGWGGDSARSLLERFGRVAVLAFGVTALTGALRATEELRGFDDLWTKSYGVVLSIKTVGVLAMVVLSALTWGRRLRLGRAESAFALAVLAATAILATFPLSPAAFEP